MEYQNLIKTLFSKNCPILNTEFDPSYSDNEMLRDETKGW